jgi:CRP-like cAMP-binding protein
VAGDFFGERSLFGLEKRNASIMAKSTVDLAVLSAESFARLLKDHPLLRDALEEAKQRREAEMEVARGLMQQQRADAPPPQKKSLRGARAVH